MPLAFVLLFTLAKELVPSNNINSKSSEILLVLFTPISLILSLYDFIILCLMYPKYDRM
jgi:hypothetical protein